MKERPHLIPALVASGLLFGAITALPYGYYQMLRWVVCGISIYIAYKAYQWDRKWATWLFASCAVLFNPILPIYLTREIWRPIDVAFGFLFIISIAVLREPAKIQTVPTTGPEESQLEEDKGKSTSPNFCPNCGYKLNEASDYCPNCGKEFDY